MNVPASRRSLGWSARLLIALILLLAGAAAATWALARYDRAAQLLGVAPPPSRPMAVRVPPAMIAVPALPAGPGQVADLEARLARVENATRRAEGSAGRADALVVAFAARRAIDRGVALGYLEPLLVDRFGQAHPGAVATIVTAAQTPVVLEQLADELEQLGPELRGGGPDEDWWTSVKRELGTVIEIRHADRPSDKPNARFDRALQRARAGQVDAALADVMRLPGTAAAGPWVAKARRYIASHRALDEIESSALLVGAGRQESGGTQGS